MALALHLHKLKTESTATYSLLVASGPLDFTFLHTVYVGTGLVAYNNLLLCTDGVLQSRPFINLLL